MRIGAAVIASDMDMELGMAMGMELDDMGIAMDMSGMLDELDVALRGATALAAEEEEVEMVELS